MAAPQNQGRMPDKAPEIKVITQVVATIGAAAIQAKSVQAHAALAALETALHDAKAKLGAAEKHMSGDLVAVFQALKKLL